MRDILDELDRWKDSGKRVALARVVDIEGSGPREAGAAKWSDLFRVDASKEPSSQKHSRS